MTTRLRIASMGAFPFPLPQGSQVYFEAQARALVAAGAECTLFAYGRGAGEPPVDLSLITPAASTAPHRMRSGPSLAKPFADAALLRTWARTARRTHFDALLAHNAEAAAIALAARRSTGVPVVYVAHTLLGEELATYLPASLAPTLSRPTSAAGARIDTALARRADGVIVLGQTAFETLAPHARGPVAVVPPGLDPRPAPEADEILATCRRHGLAPGRFHLFTGNLDGYQELGRLAAAARAMPESALPVIVASHDASGLQQAAARLPGLRCIAVRDFAAARALCAGATTLLLARTRVGGFPIKLLNYMEASRPIVAHASVAEGLVHGESGWLLSDAADSQDWADALQRLGDDPVLAARLGRGARVRLEHAHAWTDLAQLTLALIEPLVRDPSAHAR